MSVTRPILQYYGGKWKLAPWIISHFPSHKSYVEPCGGAASVLLQKERSISETYNDIDGTVVNFFRVLRDYPDDLARKIKLTPWARAEYDLSFWNGSEGDPIERARKFFVAQWMGINASTARNESTYGWRVESSSFNNRIINAVDTFHSDLITEIAGRFKYVQIENLPAQEVIKKYDTEETLFYVDPPYVLTEQRSKQDWYEFDFDEEDHFRLSRSLNKCCGFVIVSGYESTLYKRLYEKEGWKRVNKESYADQGKKRVESLWISPRTWRSIQDKMSGLPLFARRSE